MRKRVGEFKRDAVLEDDAQSMQILIQSLRVQRTDGESKKDKASKKDKTLLLNGLLEENKNAEAANRTRELLTDIKIVKNQQ